MLQLWTTKYISPALTGLAAIIACSSYFGTASRVKATEVRHPTQQHDQGDNLVPTGKGWGKFDNSGVSFGHEQKFDYARGKGPGGGGGGGGGKKKDNGIQYHGGPLMMGTVNMYYIWYGNWDFSVKNTDKILQDFANSIGGTSYFGINTTYYNASNTNVSGDVAFPKSTAATGKTNLNDSDVQDIVANAISSGALPLDDNGVLFCADLQRGQRDLRLLFAILRLACSWYDWRQRYQIWFHRKS